MSREKTRGQLKFVKNKGFASALFAVTSQNHTDELEGELLFKVEFNQRFLKSGQPLIDTKRSRNAHFNFFGVVVRNSTTQIATFIYSQIRGYEIVYFTTEQFQAIIQYFDQLDAEVEEPAFREAGYMVRKFLVELSQLEGMAGE